MGRLLMCVTWYKYLNRKKKILSLSNLWKTCKNLRISLNVVNLKFANKQIKIWGGFNGRNLYIYNKVQIKKQKKLSTRFKM
jgi:hypothetical protein